MPGRSYNSDEYRYGFQGQEKDDEVKGNGNSVNYKYRMHDPRIGRFFAVDPLASKFPHNSSYAFSENSVIGFVELEGLEKVYFGYSKKDMVQINKMTEDEVRHEFESRGLNFDSDWYDKNANANEVWTVRQGSDGWGHSTGTFIAKYNSEASYKEGYGKAYEKDTDRNFIEWRYAKDASMEGPDGMTEGLTFAAGVAGVVLTGGTLYLGSTAVSGMNVLRFTLSLDALTSINGDDSMLGNVSE